MGVMYYSAIIPCFLSAFLAKLVAGFFGISSPALAVQGVPELTFLSLLSLLAWGGCAPGGNSVLRRHAAGGTVLLQADLPAVGAGSAGGTGGGTAHPAVRDHRLQRRRYGRHSPGGGGNRGPLGVPAEILFTVLTLRAGYKGGEIVPAFFIGATFGCVAGPLLGLSASFGAAAGMIAVFCGVTNCLSPPSCWPTSCSPG